MCAHKSGISKYVAGITSIHNVHTLKSQLFTVYNLNYHEKSGVMTFINMIYVYSSKVTNLHPNEALRLVMNKRIHNNIRGNIKNGEQGSEASKPPKQSWHLD